MFEVKKKSESIIGWWDRFMKEMNIPCQSFEFELRPFEQAPLDETELEVGDVMDMEFLDLRTGRMMKGQARITRKERDGSFSIRVINGTTQTRT